MIANGGFVVAFVRHGNIQRFIDVTDWVHLVTPDIVLSATSLTVTEGTSPTATYTVTLNVQPTGNVKVRVARGAAYYVVNKAGGTQAVSQDLTFTTSTWNTGQARSSPSMTPTRSLGPRTSRIRRWTPTPPTNTTARPRPCR